MTDSRVIDPAALARLREWGGDTLVGQMVGLFLENAGARMEQIRSGVRDEDIALSHQGSHSLKSSAANVGAETVRRLAAQIEDASSEGNAAAVAELLPSLEEAFTDACTALETVKGEVAE